MNIKDLISKEYEKVSPAIVTQLQQSQDTKLQSFEEFCMRYARLCLLGMPNVTDPNPGFITKEITDTLDTSCPEYSPEDITEISLRIQKYQGTGYFGFFGRVFSSLVNTHHAKTGYDGEYLIITRHLENELFNLGYKNTGNVRILGNTGTNVCERMEAGKCIIQGNVGSLGREMKGGTIVVENDVEGECGTYMENGTITVEGNVKRSIGHGMQNGTIIVKGSAGGIGEYQRGGTVKLYGAYDYLANSFHSGKIYQYDKLIFSTWKRRIKKYKRDWIDRDEY